MTTFGFTVFGFFDAVVVLVAVGCRFGDGGSTGSLLALLLFTPFIVGSTGSSVAFRLDFAVALGSGCSDAVVFAASFVVVFVVVAVLAAVDFPVVVFEATLELALTPLTWGPVFGAVAEAFFGGMALGMSERNLVSSLRRVGSWIRRYR